MKNRCRWNIGKEGVIISTIIMVLLLSGCASKPSRFYLLNPVSYTDTQQTTHHATSQVVGLERIDLPDYLQQPQMVLRQSEYELHLDEFNRWAEPLQGNMQHVLIQNLAVFMPKTRIVTAPWQSRDPVSQIVHLSILRFDTNTQGMSTLVAKWEVLDEATRQVRTSQQKVYTTTTESLDYNSITYALNHNFNQLSRDIADSL